MNKFIFSQNPAQTHRLIPWLNRELVVLMPPNNTNAIPTILEDMREYLCLHDIQSREIRDYFISYLHEKTDHFIHEFYNFAISPFDIVNYDRSVDYNPRAQNVATVEISSNESSDGEVQVIDDGPAGSSSSTSVIRIAPESSTEVVLEISGMQEESCIINDVHVNEIAENVPAATSEVVVESSDSECQFVLALKPPHLRTPEQVSLNSASDSDVVFIPNEAHPFNTINSSSSDTEDNKPLSETRKQLKSELGDETLTLDIKNDDHIPDPSMDSLSAFNYGASTSTATLPDEIVTNQKKLNYHPLRKRRSGKSLLDSSSSSSTSSKSDSSDDEWQSKMASKCDKRRIKSFKRRLASKKLKKRRMSSMQLPSLSLLPSSEQAPNDDQNALNEDFPRIKLVIIKKFDDQHYIQKSSNSDPCSE